MQLKITFADLLLLSVVVHAVPVVEQSTDLVLIPQNDKVDSKTTNVESFADIVAREDCSTIASVIASIGSSTEFISYATTGYYSALLICRRMNGTDCDTIATAIASLIVSIAYIAGRATGAYSVGKREELSLAGFLDAAMSGDSEVFDGVEDLTHTLNSQTGSFAKTGAVELASVRNWVYDGTPVSFDIHNFGDGNGHIILPLENIGVNTTNLDKRGSGHAPGFKISYTTRLESKLTRSHRADMANALANDWASRANGNSKLSNYIGLWKTDHNANFYFRIIPESVDFGMEYESVDVCGGMAGFL